MIHDLNIEPLVLGDVIQVWILQELLHLLWLGEESTLPSEDCQVRVSLLVMGGDVRDLLVIHD